MRPTLLILAAAAALAVAGSASASTHHTYHCGTMHGGFENTIVSHDLSCSVAHKIVGNWHHQAVTQGKGPAGVHRVGDFKCHSRTTDAEHVRVKCTHQEFTNQWVTFFAGP